MAANPTDAKPKRRGGRKKGQKMPPFKRLIPAPTTFDSPEDLPDEPTTKRVKNVIQYTPHLAREICRRLMEGQSFEDVWSADDMPSKHTMIRWLAEPDKKKFREMFYYARRIAAEVRVDEIFKIADDTTNDWEYTYNKDGEINGIKPNNEAIQRSRIRIDTRKWYAAKMHPRIYGDNKHVDMDVVGDLAELLKGAVNQEDGLPPPIEGKAKEVP